MELTASEKEKIARQQDVKHQLLLAESRYLLASGWSTHEQFDSAKDGFIWKDIEGQPVSQEVAVTTQKAWDKNPEMQKMVVLRVTALKLVSFISNLKTQGRDTKQVEAQHKAMVVEMKETLCERKVG